MSRDASIASVIGAFLLFLLGHLISSSPTGALVLVWGVAAVLLIAAFAFHIHATFAQSLTGKRPRS